MVISTVTQWNRNLTKYQGTGGSGSLNRGSLYRKPHDDELWGRHNGVDFTCTIGFQIALVITGISLYQGSFYTGVLFHTLYCNVGLAQKIIRYTVDNVTWRFVTSRFHDICRQ